MNLRIRKLRGLRYELWNQSTSCTLANHKKSLAKFIQALPVCWMRLKYLRGPISRPYLLVGCKPQINRHFVCAVLPSLKRLHKFTCMLSFKTFKVSTLFNLKGIKVFLYDIKKQCGHLYDTGYPHDGRADNTAYRHDRR